MSTANWRAASIYSALKALSSNSHELSPRSELRKAIVGPFLRGDAAGFGPPFTVLIDKIEKVRSCSCVAERAMMVF